MLEFDSPSVAATTRVTEAPLVKKLSAVALVVISPELLSILKLLLLSPAEIYDIDDVRLG